MPSKPGLKAGVTSQVSMTFLGCSAICRAYARVKPWRCQGQRGFGWYLNFKATLGDLPISHATRRAQPSFLPHHHPSRLLCVTQARFTCCTMGKANKIGAFPSLLAGAWARRLFCRAWAVSPIKKKKLKRELEGVRGLFG